MAVFHSFSPRAAATNYTMYKKSSKRRKRAAVAVVETPPEEGSPPPVSPPPEPEVDEPQVDADDAADAGSGAAPPSAGHRPQTSVFWKSRVSPRLFVFFFFYVAVATAAALEPNHCGFAVWQQQATVVSGGP